MINIIKVNAMHINRDDSVKCVEIEGNLYIDERGELKKKTTDVHGFTFEKVNTLNIDNDRIMIYITK